MTPPKEISGRLKNIRIRMKNREIDVLVIYSAPGSIRFGQRGHVMYISGYESYFGDAMVILPCDENLSPLLEKGAADYFPPECTWIENVRPACMRSVSSYHNGLRKIKRYSNRDHCELTRRRDLN
jgi:hypothetical protein